MKMKMNIRKRGGYGDKAVDKATRNRMIQAKAEEMGKKKLKKLKRESALIASWFSPNKKKGFQIKIK